MNEHLSLLVGRNVPPKVICLRNKNKPWFDDQCMSASGLKQEVHFRWTCVFSLVNREEFVCCQVRANETYSQAKHQFSDRNSDVLMNVRSPHKWWSTLKSAVFDSSLSLPPLIGGGFGLMFELVGEADLLSDHFGSKQTVESVDLPLTCHPSPSLTTLACRLSEVRRLLLNLDPYGGNDQLGMFPLFLERTADVMAPSFCAEFWRFVCHGNFPAWFFRQANATSIPKGSPSSCVTNYRPISIASVL